MSPAIQQLQVVAQRAIEAGAWPEVRRAIKELWRMAPTSATAAWIVSKTCGVEPHLASAQHRVAILRSFTVEPAVPLLRAAALTHGIDLKTYVGAFNNWMQESLGTTNDLALFAPDTIILAVQTRDAAPALWDQYTEGGDFEAVATGVTNQFRNAVQALRSRHTANIVIHDLEVPVHCADGLLDQQADSGQAATIREINRRLRGLAREFTGVFLLGYDDLAARHGRQNWRDERKWLTARMPFAADSILHVANEWLKFVVCLAGRQAKVIVADLDNTLWGGVIGEDGPSGIKIGKEYPGAAWTEAQRALLACHRRGILLAIASKNNEADALPVLDTHPDMLIRSEHVSAHRINWNDKAKSILEIAAELNVGLDAVAFLDDNPAERARIESELPDVAVLPLGSDPWTYAEAIRDYPGFARVSLSAEDVSRTRLYQEQNQRAALSSLSTSLEDFYRQLQQRVEIAKVNRGTRARVAQLTNKTNQFNLTTRRYSEAQIDELANRPGWSVYAASVSDKFGDNGLVGVMITKTEGTVTEIDSMLLSCRVLGRTVETALIAFLVEECRLAGVNRLRGRFVPTRKNAPAADCLERHGFRRMEDSGEGSLWELDLDSAKIACPEWIQLNVNKEVKMEFALA